MFAILIATKNRKHDLLFTLQQITALNPDEVVVFDDGSNDGSYEAVQQQFPSVKLFRNEISKGYIFCRNKMLNETTADYAVSLDDDANFLSEKPLQIILRHFADHPNCGVIAFRIAWTTETVDATITMDNPEIVKSFVGCGHAWRMNAWREIPDYPEWFEFYGEEDFAAFQLFKKQIDVHYVPEILVQHRVNLKLRSQSAKDFQFRYRRSLRAGWYLYFLFYPLKEIPGKFAYSLAMQFKKIGKGNFKVIVPLLFAGFDVIVNIPNLLRNRNAMTISEYARYIQLKDTKIYWNSQK